MGFDNECILNIQSLAGEYFCPVCRLLVYPHEALQSQCTHLYCKPCLTYVVSTTRACPYDGYLVTEADSKPLIESNKTLAETIGKITVHCLYYRSGCTWQGPLSECTAHCSGCAFGNSPVVCNRCGIQIVHRQVQEHAQNCPSVQPQAPQAEGGQSTATTGTTAAADRTQLASQPGTATLQDQASQTTTSTTAGQDPNQQANPNSQSQAASQAGVVTSEQWYQQQQQYQQYYQQYSGYDPYYQQYYPYQQQPLQVNASHQHPVSVQTQPQPHLQVQPQPQAQPQSYPSAQAPVAAQPQNQAQVNQQQQTHIAVPPPSQVSSQTYPTAQGQTQSLPQVPTIQPQLQHGQIPQYQQPQQQPQLHPAPQAQAQPQPQPQPHLQQSQSVNPNLLPQTQNSAAHAVSGHQSYPQPQLVTPPHLMHQGGHHPQQHPGQMPNSYPQLRPPQSHVAISNQQQLGLLPSPSPVAPQVHPHSHQPLLPVQRPLMQPGASPMSQQYGQQQPLSTQQLSLVQPQMHQQGPFVQQQVSSQSQSRPLGPPHPIQQPPHSYPQPQQIVAGSHAVHPHPSNNLVGRPVTPNHGVQSQPYQHPAPSIPVKPIHLGVDKPSSYQNNILRTNNQSGVTSQQMSELPGGHDSDKSVARQEAESSSQRISSKVANELNIRSSLGASDAAENNTAKSVADLKSVDEKPTGDGGDDSNRVDISTTESLESRRTFGSDFEQQRDPVSKNMVQGEAMKDQDDVEHKVEELKSKDSPLLKAPSLLEAKPGEEQNGKMQKDKILPQDPKGPAVNGFQGVPPSQVLPGGFVQPSHLVPIADHGRHQPIEMPYGPNNNQQRPSVPAILQPTPHGLPPNQFRPQGPVHLTHPGQAPPENLPPGSFGRGMSNYGPQGPYNQGPSRISQGEPLVGPPFCMPPRTAFDSHGPPSYGPEGHPVKRSSNMMDYHADNRQLDPRAAGLETSTLSSHGERLKPLQDERMNPFSLDRAHHVGNQGRLKEDLKQFPRPSHLGTEPVPKFGNYTSSRPLDRGSHGFGMDMGPRAHEKEPRGFNFDPMIGSGPSRFLPPYHRDDAGERPVGPPGDTLGRPDFLGTVPGYGRHRMDGFVSRSPGRVSGISPHRFGRHPGDQVDGREHRFSDRFPGFPGHLHRGGFESSERDMIGQDIRPLHFRRGEHFAHHNMPGRLRLGEPTGFGDYSSHEPLGEFGGSGNFNHPRLGEPGFRSSFSLQEFPNGGGTFTGDMGSFENLRKRKPMSMGWCRICKVDCETVEGLDLHSQTREHQKMAMDMVVTIKQNAKKQKLNFTDQSMSNDASKSKNAKFEGRVNKH